MYMLYGLATVTIIQTITAFSFRLAACKPVSYASPQTLLLKHRLECVV